VLYNRKEAYMADKKKEITLESWQNMEVIASTNGSVLMTFTGYDDDPNVNISITKENIKWLRTALKQANELAFK
jgi:hypothetical protein